MALEAPSMVGGVEVLRESGETEGAERDQCVRASHQSLRIRTLPEIICTFIINFFCLN